MKLRLNKVRVKSHFVGNFLRRSRTSALPLYTIIAWGGADCMGWRRLHGVAQIAWGGTDYMGWCRLHGVASLLALPEFYFEMSRTIFFSKY